jgi:hypothetical protein
MTGAQKIVLLALGFLAAVLILTQLVLGQLIASGNPMPKLPKTHQHTGYLTVAVTLVYILTSLWFAITSPTRTKG